MPSGPKRRAPPRRKNGSNNLTTFQGGNAEETKEWTEKLLYDIQSKGQEIILSILEFVREHKSHYKKVQR